MPARRITPSRSGRGRRAVPARRVPKQPQALLRRLDQAIEDARTELRVSVPAAPQCLALAGEVGDAVVSAARRPINVRVIVEGAVLQEPTELAFARDAAAAGATVRVSRRLVGFGVQVDLSCAFWLVTDWGENGVVTVQDRDALVALASVFEHEWRTSAEPDLPAASAPGPDEIDLAVLSTLATGAKDEVVARRLGLSVRSVRRRVAYLQEQLSATSRFEAGVRAAERGWVTAPGQDET